MLYGPWMYFDGVICPLSNGNARVSEHGRVSFLVIMAVLLGAEAANDNWFGNVAS